MSTTHPAPRTQTLVLESGDRLTRTKFERRYRALPQLKKAELIEGVVYVAPPVRTQHANPHGRIIGWLGNYAAITPGVMVCDNATVRLDWENEPQPDALLRLEQVCGGQSWITDDDYIAGAPELIAEVASSSASYDLHDKWRAYQRNGVQEYLVWLVQERDLRWYRLEDGAYYQQTADTNGLLSSTVFPGLWLDIEALLTGRMQRVLTTVQTGLDSATHQAFVQRLQVLLDA